MRKYVIRLCRELGFRKDIRHLSASNHRLISSNVGVVGSLVWACGTWFIKLCYAGSVIVIAAGIWYITADVLDTEG